MKVIIHSGVKVQTAWVHKMTKGWGWISKWNQIQSMESVTSSPTSNTPRTPFDSELHYLFGSGLILVHILLHCKHHLDGTLRAVRRGFKCWMCLSNYKATPKTKVPHYHPALRCKLHLTLYSSTSYSFMHIYMNSSNPTIHNHTNQTSLIFFFYNYNCRLPLVSRELIDYWSSWIQLSALAVQVLGPDAVIAPHEAPWKAETPCGFRKGSNKGNRIKQQACLAWFTHCKSQQVFMSFNLLVWKVAERVERLVSDKERKRCKIIPELFLQRGKAEF